MRALIDNDSRMAPYWTRPNIWQGENLDHLCSRIYEVTRTENGIAVRGSLAGMSRMPFFRYTQRVNVYTDGTITVTLDGKVRENCGWLPRLGYEFTFKKPDMAFRFFGYGPGESYRDSCHGTRCDWFASTASAAYVPYVRPQEHGNHTATRVLELKDSFCFTAEAPMDVNVSIFTVEALQEAQHTDELHADGYTHVRLDYKQSGIGSNSCGPMLKPTYRLAEKDIHFTVMGRI